MNILSFPSTVENRYIILDVEYLADLQLYNRYRVSDPRPAACRWPFRRVMSASVMSVSVDAGVWVVDDFQSFTGSNERNLVRNLFRWMLEKPEHRLATWSGAAEDLPILKTAAMEHGLSLPRQLRHNERDRLGFFHLDLALVLKPGSGQFVHMTELATRLHLPGKMAGSAGQVPHLVAERNFEAVGWISECDTLLTSLLLASHLASLGQILSVQAAHFVTMRFVRERRDRANYHRELGNYISRVERRMVAEQRTWLEAC